MKKKIFMFIFLLVGALIISPKIASAQTYTDYYEDGLHCREKSMPVTIRVDNNYLPSDVDPFIKNNRTLLPFRAIGEAIGAKIEWDQTTQTAIAKKDGRTVEFKLNSKTYYINGVPHENDVAPIIVKQRTMLPVRAFSEAFQVDVTWNPELYNVDIDTPARNAINPPLPNGGSYEKNKMLSKYYVAPDKNDKNVGSWLGNGDVPLGSGYSEYIYNAVFISKLSDGTYQAVTVLEEAHSSDGSYWTTIQVKRNKDGYLSISDDKISFYVDLEHLYYKGPEIGCDNMQGTYQYVRNGENLYLKRLQYLDVSNITLTPMAPILPPELM